MMSNPPNHVRTTKREIRSIVREEMQNQELREAQLNYLFREGRPITEKAAERLISAELGKYSRELNPQITTQVQKEVEHCLSNKSKVEALLVDHRTKVDGMLRDHDGKLQLALENKIKENDKQLTEASKRTIDNVLRTDEGNILLERVESRVYSNMKYHWYTSMFMCLAVGGMIGYFGNENNKK